jgi:exo-beta-1,3-glucanase (GH17 family)
MGRWLRLTLALCLTGALGSGEGCRSDNACAGSSRADAGAAKSADGKLGGACGATTCKYFKAIGYEGYRDGQMPGYGPSAQPTCAQVKQDLTILAPYTRGIRTYNSTSTFHDGKCIPAIADELGLDLHMGIWIDDTYTDAGNLAALDDSIGVLCGGPKPGGCPNGSAHPSVKTLIVGNEYLLRVRQRLGDAIGAEARLIGYIQYVRARAPKTIEVVTGESYADWLSASAALYRAVDRIVWYSHPWWDKLPASEAAAHLKMIHERILAKMKVYGINKGERLGETGYPWAEQNGAAQGTEAAQAQYLKDLDAYAASVGLEYWFFEAFDEQWKTTVEGPVGASWGIWKADRTPHAVIAQLVRSAH